MLSQRPASAVQAYRGVAHATPGWFDGLMHARNRVMRALGMKDLGAISAVDADAVPVVGARLGIFTVQAVSPDELVVADSDRHLRVTLSFQLRRIEAQDALDVATVVHLHNAFGRLYMLPVAPVHRRIIPLMLTRYARQHAANA